MAPAAGSQVLFFGMLTGIVFKNRGLPGFDPGLSGAGAPLMQQAPGPAQQSSLTAPGQLWVGQEGRGSASVGRNPHGGRAGRRSQGAGWSGMITSSLARACVQRA